MKPFSYAIAGSFLLILAGFFRLQAQENIAAARALGAGATVQISGIVCNGAELGQIRYMQDLSAGMAIYSSLLADIQRGDSITVKGELKDYQGLLEMDPVLELSVHSWGHPLPEPHVLTPSGFSEAFEGMLVRVRGAQFSSQGVFTRSAYAITASGELGQLYINDGASPLIGTSIPSSAVDITGPLGSYQGIYQLLPRDQNDLVSGSSISMEEEPRLASQSQHLIRISWATNVAGSTEAFWGYGPDLEQAVPLRGDTGMMHMLELDALSPAQVVYLRPFSVHEEDTAMAATRAYITISESGGNMRALFTHPVDPSVSLGLMEAEYLDGSIDNELIAYLDAALESIDMAIYNLDNKHIANITDALNRAHDRGVVVRVVYDAERNAPGLETLKSAIGKQKSPWPDYPVYGIMHNKFVVIDAASPDPMKSLVWTGSTNLTDNQIMDDPNNVIIIQDQSLARAYTIEFNEMFGSEGPLPNQDEARFGPDKTDNTPHEFIIGGRKVECYFSPSDGTHSRILKSIASADQSIQVATMLITKEDIGQALVAAENATAGVEVLINGYDQHGAQVVWDLQRSLGEDMRLKGEAGIMHHKYLIVDQDQAESGPLLLTGSHNWSSSAQVRNDENTLIVYDQGVANAYYQEFVMRFGAGRDLVSAGPLNPVKPAHEISVYPNPASHLLHVDARGAEIIHMTLLDLSGRVIREFDPHQGLSLDLSGLERGCYVLRLSLASGHTSTLSLLLQ